MAPVHRGGGSETRTPRATAGLGRIALEALSRSGSESRNAPTGPRNVTRTIHPLLDLAHSVKSNPGSLDASDHTTDRALLGLSALAAAAVRGAAALIPTEVSHRRRGKVATWVATGGLDFPNVSRLEMQFKPPAHLAAQLPAAHMTVSQAGRPGA